MMPYLYKARGWIEFLEEYSNIRRDVKSYYSTSTSQHAEFYVEGWQLNNYEFNYVSYIFYGLQTQNDGVVDLIKVLSLLSRDYSDSNGEFAITSEDNECDFHIKIREGTLTAIGVIPESFSLFLKYSGT